MVPRSPLLFSLLLVDCVALSWRMRTAPRPRFVPSVPLKCWLKTPHHLPTALASAVTRCTPVPPAPSSHTTRTTWHVTWKLTVAKNHTSAHSATMPQHTSTTSSVTTECTQARSRTSAICATTLAGTWPIWSATNGCTRVPNLSSVLCAATVVTRAWTWSDTCFDTLGRSRINVRSAATLLVTGTITRDTRRNTAWPQMVGLKFQWLAMTKRKRKKEQGKGWELEVKLTGKKQGSICSICLGREVRQCTRATNLRLYKILLSRTKLPATYFFDLQIRAFILF